jgi:hypothetical protein
MEMRQRGRGHVRHLTLPALLVPLVILVRSQKSLRRASSLPAVNAPQFHR